MNVSNTVAVVLAWIGCAAFVFPYMFLVPQWWKETHRVHVVAFSGDLFLFFTLYLLRSIIDPDVFEYIRSVLLWILALVVLWRAAIFLSGVIKDYRKHGSFKHSILTPKEET